MEDDLSVDNIITTFLLNTTRLRPRLTEHAVFAAIYCGVLANVHPPDDEEAGYIPLPTGSVAEFYIEPMLKCFGDIDLMFHQNNMLAIPRGHAPPIQLPDEFHKYVKVVEVIDSHFPGYVYLVLRYLLTHGNDDTYNSVEYDGRKYLSIGLAEQKNTSALGTIEKHGPAEQYSKEGLISVDRVYCVRCLLWPQQAAAWPTRRRNYEWPDSATVDRVVSNGCDLVQMAHPQCRQHVWTNKNQWRLSFSRAEIVLMNSWMPLHQIVYHLLRVFLKTGRLTESADNSGSGTLSNYHIKTLMLWACELKPRSWWSDNFSFTALCADLLNLLAQWLNQGYCPHYFITGCNLFDHCDRAKQILAAERLSEINKGEIIKWFICSYLPRCYHSCPVTVVRQFDDVDTIEKLQRAVSAVVEWRRSNVLLDNWRAFETAAYNLSRFISAVSVTVRSYPLWIKELTKLDAKLRFYVISVSCLHVAQNILSHGFADRWTKVLSILCDDLGCEKHSTNGKKALKLVEFLQKSAIDRLTTFRLLQARDFGTVATIVTTDFEAIYAYKRGDYQHCLQLSAQNVRTLLYAGDMSHVPIYPEFLQLLDDDIVSLTALTLIVKPECRYINPCYSSITQLTLSLYLITQCQLKLHHSVISLAHTYYCTKFAQRRYLVDAPQDDLILKLLERKLLTYIPEFLTLLLIIGYLLSEL